MDDSDMVASERMRLRAGGVAFLAGGTEQTRIVVVHGRAGMGTTTFIDLLHADLLMRGVVDVLSIDHDPSSTPARRADFARRVAGGTRSRIIIATRELTAELGELVAAHGELHEVELPALDRAAARALLADLGHLPWSLESTAPIDQADGNPGNLLEAALGGADAQRAVARLADATVDLANLPSGLTTWLASRIEGSSIDRARLHASATAVVERGMRATGDLVDHFHDACAVLAEHAFACGDFAAAVQLADRAKAHLPGPDAELVEPGVEVARRWSALVGCAARAQRVEATANLSLHARAGSASRAGLVIVEIRAWQLIAGAARDARDSDSGTSLRATTRAIELADGAGAVGIGLVLRLE
ncbi:MAG: hypothetical protein H7287_11955, partial [Thermoleophilia bacterium]|nr:hypothetical protein [Thermoleophilia bacterium]